MPEALRYHGHSIWFDPASGTYSCGGLNLYNFEWLDRVKTAIDTIRNLKRPQQGSSPTEVIHGSRPATAVSDRPA